MFDRLYALARDPPIVRTEQTCGHRPDIARHTHTPQGDDGLGFVSSRAIGQDHIAAIARGADCGVAAKTTTCAGYERNGGHRRGSVACGGQCRDHSTPPDGFYLAAWRWRTQIVRCVSSAAPDVCLRQSIGKGGSFLPPWGDGPAQHLYSPGRFRAIRARSTNSGDISSP